MKRALLLGLGACVSVGLGCAAMTRLQAKVDPNAKAAVDKCAPLLTYDVNRDEEQAIGGALSVGMVAKNNGIRFEGARISEDDRLNTYVSRVGRNLAALSARPDLPWTFGVLDTPNVNAFSTPGGYVFVSRGLLAGLHNEAELAGVLGHEIGHVVLKHTVEKYKHVKNDACVAAFSKGEVSSVGGAAVGVLNQMLNTFTHALGSSNGYIDLNDKLNFTALFKLAGELQEELDNGFDQDQEYAADKLGLMLAIQAGYNPKPFIDYIGQLPDGGDGDFGHHPPSSERAQRLARWPEWIKDQGPLLTADDVRAYPKVELDQRISAATAP